jgi:hypothetical protein
MRPRLFAALLALCLLSAGPVLAQSFSADDFLPPAMASDQAQADKLLLVQNPGEVKTQTGDLTGQPAIKAASPQDAINAFIEQRTSGCQEFTFPSGFGFAASGIGTYKIHQSNTTTRIEQRNAYVAAYVNAKRNLGECLNGLSTEGKNKLAESMTNIDTTDRTLTQMKSNNAETLTQAVNAMLRGYVVYDVHDDLPATTVYVTIVATPKTMGYFERPDPQTIVAESVHEGLNQIITEVKKGLVPPVGGRTVFVPATQEIAYVGFGSAVIRFDSDPAIQTRQNLNAEKIAKMRASDALCGLIIGDRISATDTLDSQTKSMTADFEKISENDPIMRRLDSPNYRALSQRRQDFLSVESNTSLVTSLRKGVLPPGVSTQGWRDQDNTFAYAISVYLPSATGRAREAADMMRDSRIVDAPKGGPGAPQPQSPEVKPGPSGRIEADGAI